MGFRDTGLGSVAASVETSCELEATGVLDQRELPIDTEKKCVSPGRNTDERPLSSGDRERLIQDPDGCLVSSLVSPAFEFHENVPLFFQQIA